MEIDEPLNSPMTVSDQIFRAYDIRGIVGQGLDPQILFEIGRAVGSENLEQENNCLIVGADARLSSPSFAKALMEGVRASGCDVIDIGIVPTPLLYYATHILDTGSGVMITGSHNPKNYNGVKIVLNKHCLAARQIDRLRERIVKGQLQSGKGCYRKMDITQSYLDRVNRDLSLKHRYKVVVDCGNGVCGKIAPALFSRLGCQVSELYCELDGNFPNHHPDPTIADNLEDLIAKVKAEKADLGIAFDGDGDRVGLVTHTGSIIDADRLLMLFAEDLLPDHPGAQIVYDVKSSQHLPRLIARLGGKPVMCKSGHSFVKQKMEESGALLGGEFSAHIFFKHRWYGFDDGLYTAARFLELIDKKQASADCLLNNLPATFATPELKIAVPEAEKFQIMARLQETLRFEDADINTLDGLRLSFAEGWALIRASNTTPALVLRFEANSKPQLSQLITRFQQELSRALPALKTDFGSQ